MSARALIAWFLATVFSLPRCRRAVRLQRPECNLQRLGFRALALFFGNHEWMKSKLSVSELRCEHGAHPVGEGVLRAVLLLTILTILVLVW